MSCCEMRRCRTVDIIKHRPLRIVLGWGTIKVKYFHKSCSWSRGQWSLMALVYVICSMCVLSRYLSPVVEIWFILCWDVSYLRKAVYIYKKRMLSGICRYRGVKSTSYEVTTSYEFLFLGGGGDFYWSCSTDCLLNPGRFHGLKSAKIVGGGWNFPRL